MDSRPGVAFPDESTSAAGRTILAEAFARADPVGAMEVRHDTAWRRHYLAHFRGAVEAGIGDPAAAHALADDGLRSARETMRYGDAPLSAALDGGSEGEPFATAVTVGGASPERELSIPYRGERLRGKALLDQLDDWVRRGVVTPSCSEAVQRVMDHPEWLSLEGDTVAILGAGAEMGPYRALMRWGASVAAVDLPDAGIQSRIAAIADGGAGGASLPVRGDVTGADLLTELPALADWLTGLDGRVVLGTYCYADGGTHVRLSLAADVLATHLTAARPDTALAFLATPTDVFAVPGEQVERANEAYRRRSAAKLLRTPLRVASRGRLLQRNYPPGADPGICDALVPQQGPNYALAKRIQRWRATVARRDGTTVSLNVAPATRTRSVVKNRALAAAYAGAHRFGVEVFDPATSNTLMAALLVHDLRAGRPAQAEPWQDEAENAAHGGLWTTAYHPRSALGLAAVLGIGALRS